MSTDAFTPAVFPRLFGPAVDAESDRARARGYAAGHAEGFRAARAEAAAHAARAQADCAAEDADRARLVAEAVSALRAATDAVAGCARELTAAAQEQVFARAVELAGVIVAAELSDPEASAAAAVRRVMAVADPADVCEVRVSPDDLHTLERVGAVADGLGPGGLRVIADPTLVRGDAVATLDDGHIDARIGAAVERARRSAADAAERSRAEGAA
ncbi:FliH/SctL family protein [Microbacterium sp.]|uniref:FliH/SctL family protein n=1 Tax=Microbacterium sp. TaxID=51671 RepID=UPI003A90E3AB